MNIDFLGAMADRLPGTSGAAMAQQWFGAIPEGFVSNPTRSRYPVIAAKLPWAAATASRRVHRTLEYAKRWWFEETRATATMSLPAAIEQLRRAKKAYEDFTSDHIIAQMAVVQPMFEAVQKIATAAGAEELTDKLLVGYGSHAELEVVEGLWALSCDEITVEEFLAEHGAYAPLQGELDCWSWREDSSPVERLREQYRNQDLAQSPARSDAARAAERATARAEVMSRLPRHRRALAAAVFKFAAGAIPLRGTAKAASLRAIDVGRAAARQIGAHLVAAGIVAEPADVFYLTVEELVAANDGQYADTIAKRRALRQGYLGLTIPAYWRARPEPTAIESQDREEREVRIVACGASSGVVEAPVRVLLDPYSDDIDPGEILVARFTDPGWASVMYLAGALVVDIGGLQSHAAVIARELGIPCVMGTIDGTMQLRTGDICRVDGLAGTVELVKPCGGP
ncbi:PEP-utilizing enzyme [Nocardia neocaledoniensis]|uniref:PEP-utilizing enzyme n=1 Tax=Nocardia neocaledoniensis TaxID=236511 RepID=UPI002457E97D|nr:PEP-utilizing enzyme [Nocardia neocaledoniensis]